jgi:hypothetical protein
MLRGIDLLTEVHLSVCIVSVSYTLALNIDYLGLCANAMSSLDIPGSKQNTHLELVIRR